MIMRILLAAFLVIFFASQVYSQDVQKKYYIVVGAFAKSKEAYAQRFSISLRNEGYEAFYINDPERNLLLVFIGEFNEREQSISEMLAIRKGSKFPEAWVRVLKTQPPVPAEEIAETKMITEEVKSEVKTAPAKTDPPTTEPVMPSTSQPALAEVKEPIDTVSIKSEPVTIVVPAKGPPTPQNTPVVFHMFDANDNSKVIEGNIEIVDTQRARLIQSTKSTDTVDLPNPNSDSGMLSLITDVFGYRKLQHEVSYKQPVNDTSRHYFDLDGDYYVARFEMVRYHKGDIATLYHVFFYNDAAIMMPESKYELNKLLDMMRSNNRYTIRLHGHTNGNSRGKIISMGPSKEFFSVNAPDVKEGSGSSKELSGQRAEVIKEWLVAQGIAADRIEVKAWGGKRMIHDKNSNNARRNVRVEVEVLSE